MRECEACGGVLGFIGMLGRRAWYRCLNCGLDSSSEVSDEELNAADDHDDGDPAAIETPG